MKLLLVAMLALLLSGCGGVMMNAESKARLDLAAENAQTKADLAAAMPRAELLKAVQHSDAEVHWFRNEASETWNIILSVKFKVIAAKAVNYSEEFSMRAADGRLSDDEIRKTALPWYAKYFRKLVAAAENRRDEE